MHNPEFVHFLEVEYLRIAFAPALILFLTFLAFIEVVPVLSLLQRRRPAHYFKLSHRTILGAAVVSIVAAFAAGSTFVLSKLDWALTPDVSTFARVGGNLVTFKFVGDISYFGFLWAFPFLSVLYSKIPLDAIGFRRPSARLPEIVSLVAISFITILVFRHIFYHYLLPIIAGQALANNVFAKLVYVHSQYVSSNALSKVRAALIEPFVEEWIFRGLFFQYFKTVMSSRWALILQAIVFAAAHDQPDRFVVTCFMGLVLGFVYRETKSIYVPMAFHSIFNLVAAI